MDEKEALRKEFKLAKLTFEELKEATPNSIEELAKDLKFAYHYIVVFEKEKSEGIVYFLFYSILFAFYARILFYSTVFDIRFVLLMVISDQIYSVLFDYI